MFVTSMHAPSIPVQDDYGFSLTTVAWDIIYSATNPMWNAFSY